MLKKRVTINELRQQVIRKVLRLEDINFEHVSIVEKIGRELAFVGDNHGFKKIINARRIHGSIISDPILIAPTAVPPTVPVSSAIVSAVLKLVFMFFPERSKRSTCLA